MLSHSFEQMLPIATRVARVRSTAAIASGWMSRADFEELLQEGVIACWLAFAHYDPGRASIHTFFESVVANKLTSMFRRSRLVPAAEPDLSEICASGRTRSQFELRSDVMTVLSKATEADRQLAFALTEYSPSETSRKLNLARSTVYERMRKLRVLLGAAGLGPCSNARTHDMSGFKRRSRALSISRGMPDVKGEHVGAV
jgi:RNA polymerase sigma factor (sigma-70 family)